MENYISVLNPSYTIQYHVETVVPVVPVLTAPIADLRLASICNKFLSNFHNLVKNYLLINHVFKNKNK